MSDRWGFFCFDRTGHGKFDCRTIASVEDSLAAQQAASARGLTYMEYVAASEAEDEEAEIGPECPNPADARFT